MPQTVIATPLQVHAATIKGDKYDLSGRNYHQGIHEPEAAAPVVAERRPLRGPLRGAPPDLSQHFPSALPILEFLHPSTFAIFGLLG